MRPDWARVQIVKDDVWRRELCPGCGIRLIGLGAWKDHGSRHGWGSKWLAVRLQAARPGETIEFDPELFRPTAETVEVQTVEDATWRAGIPA